MKDVGTRQAPSLETVKALKPDLIITSKVRSEANYEQLNEIAPTLMFDPYSTESEYEEMRATLKTIGTAVGKPEAADAALKDLDAKIEAARRKLAAGKRDGAEVTVARGYTTDGAAVVEVLTDSTIPGALLPRLGLRNAWKGEADAYGMSKVDIESSRRLAKTSRSPRADGWTSKCAGPAPNSGALVLSVVAPPRLRCRVPAYTTRVSAASVTRGPAASAARSRGAAPPCPEAAVTPYTGSSSSNDAPSLPRRYRPQVQRLPSRSPSRPGRDAPVRRAPPTLRRPGAARQGGGARSGEVRGVLPGSAGSRPPSARPVRSVRCAARNRRRGPGCAGAAAR